LAQYLHSEQISAIYSSPLRRARQTAAAITEMLQGHVEIRDGLAEWDRNSAEYIPVEELKAADDPRWHALVAGVWEGDEPPEDFHTRVHATIESIVAAHRSQRVVIVCHGGVINSYLASILGIESANGFFYPEYTSIHRVAAASTGQRSIVTLNETAHLRNSDVRVGLS